MKLRSATEGKDTLSLHDDIEKDLPSQDISLDDLLCDQCEYEDLRLAINNLTEDEKELIDFIFYKNNTVQTYAYYKNLCHSTASQRKNVIFEENFKLYKSKVYRNLILKKKQG